MKSLISINEEVLEKLSKEEKIFLKHKLADPMIQKFFSLQAEAAEKQFIALNPANYSNDRATEYLVEARGYKLVEFFWKQLVEFCVVYSARS